MITIEPTDELIDHNGVRLRRWHGTTAEGQLVDVLVQSVRPDGNATEDEVEQLGQFLQARMTPITDKATFVRADHG